MPSKHSSDGTVELLRSIIAAIELACGILMGLIPLLKRLIGAFEARE